MDAVPASAQRARVDQVANPVQAHRRSPQGLGQMTGTAVIAQQDRRRCQQRRQPPSAQLTGQRGDPVLSRQPSTTPWRGFVVPVPTTTTRQPSAAQAAATSPKFCAGQRRRGSVAPGWITTTEGCRAVAEAIEESQTWRCSGPGPQPSLQPDRGSAGKSGNFQGAKRFVLVVGIGEVPLQPGQHQAVRAPTECRAPKRRRNGLE